MKVLVTFPGKFGDLLWQLPLIRAISRRVGAPVHLRVMQDFAGICPLLAGQPYLASVQAYETWIAREGAPLVPRVPDDMGLVTAWDREWDLVLHLGYRGWPEPDVIRHTLATANVASAIPGSKWTRIGRFTMEDLDLSTPWITLPPVSEPLPDWSGVAVALTDEFFELKFGLMNLVFEQLHRTGVESFRVLATPGSRWDVETWPMPKTKRVGTWYSYAQTLAGASVVLADCAAPHVLAVAMGKPVVLAEPCSMRRNPVFYPLGTTGPVHLVCGADGQPTTDARAVNAALQRFL